jgi:type IV pilus assembly protein PilO
MNIDFEKVLSSLQEFDINDLDLENIGSWPIAVKVIMWVVAFTIVLTVGYIYHVQGLQDALKVTQKEELDLKQEYEQKAFQAANLDAYQKQMQEMEVSFGALISQLPSDTEVPGLLEDITNKGLLNGLEFSSISLRPETAKEFYVELPISLVAIGKYHDLGAFVSGMAGLPRIVTLHEFTIAQEGGDNGMLSLNITAKTYRYKEGEEG